MIKYRLLEMLLYKKLQPFSKSSSLTYFRILLYKMLLRKLKHQRPIKIALIPDNSIYGSTHHFITIQLYFQNQTVSMWDERTHEQQRRTDLQTFGWVGGRMDN